MAAPLRARRPNAKPGSSPISFAFAPDDFFYASEALDFALVAVFPNSEQDGLPLAPFGHLPLVETLGKAVVGEWLTIIQHPNGERKQVCVRENQLIRIEGDVLWYSTDTLGGSSGAPVLNNGWIVVALHHSGPRTERRAHPNHRWARLGRAARRRRPDQMGGQRGHPCRSHRPDPPRSTSRPSTAATDLPRDSSKCPPGNLCAIFPPHYPQR
jgi:Trypsin-like peptidase domain